MMINFFIATAFLASPPGHSAEGNYVLDRSTVVHPSYRCIVLAFEACSELGKRHK